ncbi:MAG TPA: acyl-CoA dehydrogenase [Phaeodactylibacter sp.]|nr:acyl-CoA dehydrogenase [Phaeodactylibacter sp.]
MSNPADIHQTVKGGEFLIKESDPQQIFIPEDFDEETRMIKGMADDFVKTEVAPNTDAIEAGDFDLSVKLLSKAAELGLVGAHMPEAYGGMGLPANVVTAVTDSLGPTGSWSVTFAAHTGIGMLPILYFGTEEQKEKYLPRLISAELKASYCLTEPSSGSDALAAKTRADLSEDGKYYILNGQKMWITNAGFADLYIVFAQVDGDKFTGFIVERESEGLTLGAEEKKLGIKGSSTRQVFFENVKVPKENLLGEIGKGHKIAFNALNVGRFKLCVLCVGASKHVIGESIQYAKERIQFGRPIADFGAIKYKISEQIIRIFASESAEYRTSNDMQQMEELLKAEGASYGDAKLKAAEEYAIECALLKVAGSEALSYVVDENVQIHGGMGFSEEGHTARYYRDARINRIYEGTNEINRLLAVDMLLKRALKGRIDLIGPAWAVQKELAAMPSMDKPEGPYGEELKAVRDFKKAILMTAGAAAKLQMEGQLNLEEEQEIIMNVADMMLDTFLAESLLLRTMKLAGMEQKPAPQDVYDAMLRVFLHDATARITANGRSALASFAEGDLLRVMLMGLKRYTKYPPAKVNKLRRLVADYAIEQGKYPL